MKAIKSGNKAVEINARWQARKALRKGLSIKALLYMNEDIEETMKIWTEFRKKQKGDKGNTTRRRRERPTKIHVHVGKTFVTQTFSKR